MRYISRRFAPLATAALAAVLITGCGEIQEINNAVDDVQNAVGNVQACAQAVQAAGEVAGKAIGQATDPAALEKTLNDAAADLQTAADKVGNTTLQEAMNDLAKSYENFSVADANNAVDAAQKVVTDSTKFITNLNSSCGGGGN
ncbi:hypothetical protein [Sinosporangium siamense]|uniref:Lipoprotein n=1 Tax=Sinosporangium siamense TaxID=1367973 RepID=A0A919RE57_9ACTN|nr:hypothetical protein [Sinosporangium siamense]GII92230.1 hypothetical protein Ssi02_24610 [Sinosporangium siamense]